MSAVLVSGVGQLIGYGVVRSLKLARPDLRIIGTDIYPHAVGQAWSDTFNVCPPAASPQFPDFLAQLVEREKIQCIFSGFPQELPALGAIRPILQQLGASIVLNSDPCLALGEDKWLLARTMLASARHCIPTMRLHPETDYDEVAAELGTPFIVKPRRGSSSKGLAIIDHARALANAISQDGSLIAQKLVGATDREFTAAVHGDGNGGYCASIVMRRWLGPQGHTIRSEVVASDPFHATFDEICAIAKPHGPTNLQFRVQDGVPYLLEINPRISSSSYMRTLCGYNEPLMAYDHFTAGRLPTQPEVIARRLIRYAEDRIW